MAGILQNVFSKGLYTLADPENMSKIKQLVNHSTLYFGLIFYTAIGAWVGTNKFWHERAAFQRSAFGWSTAGNDVVATISIISVATFSHRRSARIKKLI